MTQAKEKPATEATVRGLRFIEQQKQRYSISIETQAAFWILLPIFLIVALLAIGGRQ
jgi:hypothetical protein